ncbi:histidine--tRNA ligase [soil metagenome]
MALSTQPYKGARDFYPEEKRMQSFMFKKMIAVCERFGYEAYDAPILEPTELYLSKGNEEIIQDQTYSFTDRGGRNVTMRTEMTPSVSRMVAGKRQQLVYPLRWYSIPQCWRYERMQRGRGREFYQLNVDIFGSDDLFAEQEIIMLANEVMKSFKAKPDMYTIKINSRRLMNHLFTTLLHLDETTQATLSRLIDKMHKMDHAEFIAQSDMILTPSARDNGGSQLLQAFLSAEDIQSLPEQLAGNDSLTTLQELMHRLDKNGIRNVVFDPTLMRGFDYYTDIVFEVFDTNPDNNRSMFGGGRYDGLVASFGAEPLPTVGFGMGDLTLMNFLEGHGILPQPKTTTEVYTIMLGDVYDEALAVVEQLRDMGVRVAFDFTNRKIDKMIKAADKKSIPYVLFIGEDELNNDQYALKHLESGEEERHGVDRLVSIIKDRRKQL